MEKDLKGIVIGVILLAIGVLLLPISQIPEYYQTLDILGTMQTWEGSIPYPIEIQLDGNREYRLNLGNTGAVYGYNPSLVIRDPNNQIVYQKEGTPVTFVDFTPQMTGVHLIYVLGYHKDQQGHAIDYIRLDYWGYRTLTTYPYSGLLVFGSIFMAMVATPLFSIAFQV